MSSARGSRLKFRAALRAIIIAGIHSCTTILAEGLILVLPGSIAMRIACGIDCNNCPRREKQPIEDADYQYDSKYDNDQRAATATGQPYQAGRGIGRCRLRVRRTCDDAYKNQCCNDESRRYSVQFINYQSLAHPAIS
jgi:hypothetical protein